MANGDTFNTEITADPSKFEQGMRAAVQSAATASDQINAQFKKVADAVDRFNKVALSFVAVLAGGGALKKFISDANEWNSSAALMAARLGISTEKASVLNTALARLGLTSDTYIAASEKLSKQVNSNAQAFEVLGVKTKDAAGQYRPVVDVMGEVNQKLAEIKNPIEQNIAGQQVYGKGWAEVRGILKLTAEQMQASEARARQLGLIVGPEGAAMSKQYSAQMRDLNLVGKSLEVQFGNALLPVFTRVGAFLGQEGPQMGQVFARVLNGIGFAAASLWLALKDMGDGLGSLAAQAAALLSGDLAAFRAIGAERDRQAKANEAAYEKLKANFLGGGQAPAALPQGPDLSKGPHYQFKAEGGGGGADKSRMAQWEADLADRKASLERQGLMEGQYRQMSKADELTYWTELKNMRGLSDAERVSLSRKVAEVEMAGIRQTFEEKVAVLQAEAAAFKNNTDEKLRIEREVQAMYQAGTKEYEAAQKRIVEIQRQAAEQQKQISQMRAQAERDARMATITAEEQAVRTAEQIGLLSQAQVLDKQREFEARRYDIARQALEDKLQLAALDPDRSPAEVERINLELEQLEIQHQARMGEIRSAMQVDQMAPLTNTYKAAEQAIANAINGILTRTMSLKQAMASIWQGISQAIIKEISAIIAKKVAAWAVEKALTLAGIGAKASEAGAGAASSMASIPYVGPVLALAAMAAVFAGVSGMSSKVPSASAAGGYDIPGTINPIVQAHAREMVLPAKHADVIRGLADGQQVASPVGPPVELRGVSTGEFFIAARSDLVKVINALRRDNALK